MKYLLSSENTKIMEIIMATCKTCDGKGSTKCPKCKGSGRVGGGILTSSSQCSNCHGSGVTKCGACHGKGHD